MMIDLLQVNQKTLKSEKFNHAVFCLLLNIYSNYWVQVMGAAVSEQIGLNVLHTSNRLLGFSEEEVQESWEM